MTEWRVSTWGDEFELAYGKALRTHSDGIGPVRVFGSNGPIGWTDAALSEGPGVILGRKGAYRGINYSPSDFFVIDTAYYVIARNDNDVRWLYYAMRYHELGNLDDGSPIPSTTRAAVYPRPLQVPPVHEQKRMASVLGAFDDKIEANVATAGRLLDTAELLFRAWLVDYLPVGRLDPKEIPVGVTAGIPESPPDGWALRPFAEIATFLNGLALQKYPPAGDDTDLPVIKIAQLRRGGVAGADRAGSEVPKDYVIGDGDLLFSWSGTLDVRFWYGGPGALNQHLFKVTSEFPSWFSYLWIREHLPWFQSVAAGKATTMGHIKREHLRQALVAVPPKPVLEAVGTVLGPMFDLVRELNLESRQLAATRDGLLAALFSRSARIPAEAAA
jgi:type I restriction enzyme S subunit